MSEDAAAIRDSVVGSPQQAPDHVQRRAWKARAHATAQTAALGATAHRVAADRDKWLSTGLITVSAGVGAFGGFSGITEILTRTQASVAAAGSAVIAAVVAVLVNNSHRADHEAAARSYAMLQDDAIDFSEVTVTTASLDKARTDYAALLAHRNKVLDTVTPISVHTLRSAERRLKNAPGSIPLGIDVLAAAMTTAVGSRFTLLRRSRPK